MVGAMLDGVCVLIPGVSAGISVGIVLLFSDPIDSAVATGAAVAAAVVVSGGATVVAAGVVADGKKLPLKILFCDFKSSSSSASGNLCSAAIAAAVFVIVSAAAAAIDVAAADGKKSFQFFFHLPLNSPDHLFNCFVFRSFLLR